MINITQKAAEKIKRYLQQRGRGIGIRIGVKTTGCSGLAYVLEYVDEQPTTNTDVMFTNNDVVIWVDKKSLVYVDGLEMDWVRNGLNGEFDSGSERTLAVWIRHAS